MGNLKCLVLILALLVSVVIPASAIVQTSVTTHLDTSNATPFTIWALSLLSGAGLFLITLRSRQLTSELEADAIISVIAWVPIGFTAATSFAVDRIVSSFAVADTSGAYTILEDHIIYHFDFIGIAYGVFSLVAIINTARILSLHKALKLQGEQER